LPLGSAAMVAGEFAVMEHVTAATKRIHFPNFMDVLLFD
jgi:hypothetical protein